MSITVSTSDMVKVYDGKPLICEDFYISDGNLASGHSITVKTSGSITSVGKTINHISEIKILDEDGEDVTYMYKITKNEGVLEVLPRRIKISTGSATKTYDGLPLTCHDYWVSSGSVVENQTIEVEMKNSQTEIGSGKNSYTFVKIIDNDSGRNVTENYNIETGKIGTLVVY